MATSSTSGLKIECQFQRIDVGVVTIIDNHTAPLTFFDLKAHGHGFQLEQTFSNDGFRQSHEQQYSQAMQGVFHRRIIGKRQDKRALLSFPGIGDGGTQTVQFFSLYV